jgi:hypothetical protein
MDEIVVKFYRRLCRMGFKYTGEIKNPSIFLDTIGEKIRICSRVAHAYIHIYIDVRDGVIDDIKYLCICDPTANVVVEILCILVEGAGKYRRGVLKESPGHYRVASSGVDAL